MELGDRIPPFREYRIQHTAYRRFYDDALIAQFGGFKSKGDKIPLCGKQVIVGRKQGVLDTWVTESPHFQRIQNTG